MRKASLILLMVALTAMFAASSAFAAGVIGTPHDVNTFVPKQGTCSVCHIPHKSSGNRLWAETMSTESLWGTVGNLCSACHTDTGGYDTLNEANGAINTVFAGSAHGFVTDEFVYAGQAPAGSAGDTEVPASGLPYSETNDAEDDTAANVNWIQCTTCHNVHDNATSRPFLRVNIRDLCIQCHAGRANKAGAWIGSGDTIGLWDTATMMGAANPGTHPVGTNISGDVTQRGGFGLDSPIAGWQDDIWNAGTGLGQAGGILKVMQPFDDPGGAHSGTGWDTGSTSHNEGHWNLGLHVANITVGNSGGSGQGVPGVGNTVDDGVVCVSCHAVHGVQKDSNATIGANIAPQTNLLARGQAEGEQINPGAMSVANGNTSAFNALCEMCHASDAVWTAGNAFEQNDPAAGAYGNASRPNPGATKWTHPIDDAAVVNNAGVTFPSTDDAVKSVWPQGSFSTDSDLTGNGVICESCHVPHPFRNKPAGGTYQPNADGKGRGDVLVDAGAFILRAPLADICSSCHRQNISTTHHPVGPMGLDGGAGIGAAVDDGNIGNGNNDLECQDCHNGRGAHNWLGQMQVGLDVDWTPVNNGRDAANTMAGELALSSGLSEMCEGCHYKLDGAGLNDSPTFLTQAESWDTNELVTGQGAGSQDSTFEKHGQGTHFLGSITHNEVGGTVDFASSEVEGNGINVTSDAWPGGGWSRWGSDTAGEHLVCESCHELEPDRNEQGSKLLLYWFQEEEDSPATDVDFPRYRGTGQNLATSFFCEGCHGLNGPSNTHALSGDTVSRTGSVLENDPSRYLSAAAPTATPAYPTGGGTIAGTSSFPGADMVSCDSCHQVHDAATLSGTYILEAPSENLTDLDSVYNPRGGDATPASEHPRGNDDLDYTGFCDQCHKYTQN